MQTILFHSTATNFDDAFFDDQKERFFARQQRDSSQHKNLASGKNPPEEKSLWENAH